MNFNDLPLFAMLKGRLSYLDARQKLTAENVANADTPQFTPQDLKPFTVAPAGASLEMAGVEGASPQITSPGHIALAPTSTAAASPAWKGQKSPDSETQLNGNSVVLEDEMVKMNDSRMNYNAAINFYEQSMAMVQTAIRIPGKG
jgi:flagellar basal-body rod protein FlgB